MIEIFGYKFVETWGELSPRYAEYDSFVELSLSPFPKYAHRQADGIGPKNEPKDINPMEVRDLMVSGPVLMAYANDLTGRLAGLIQDRKVKLSKTRAAALATIEAKSEAERSRKLSVNPDVQSIEWELADLENMRDHVKGAFKTLTYMSEVWRSVYYGTQQEQKRQAPIEAPVLGGNTQE